MKNGTNNAARTNETETLRAEMRKAFDAARNLRETRGISDAVGRLIVSQWWLDRAALLVR